MNNNSRSSNNTINNNSTTSNIRTNSDIVNKLERKLDSNEDKILTSASTILDISYDSMNSNRSRKKIETIQEDAMDKYNELSEASSEIKESDNSNIPIAKLIALEAQDEACKHLTTSVTKVDKIVRDTYASGYRIWPERQQYDEKMRQLEYFTKDRNEKSSQLKNHLNKEVKKDITDSNTKESLIDEYADLSSEPGDWTGGDD